MLNKQNLSALSLLLLFTAPLLPEIPTRNSRSASTSKNSSIGVDTKEPAPNFLAPARISYTEEDIQEMEYVFNNSPLDAKNIVKHLKDPQFLLDGRYRYAMFVGTPGSGKTIMAQAIAYKMAEEEGWEDAFITSGELLGSTRNQTVVQLRTRLYALLAKNIPVIVVLDELNELLENTESSQHDTSATAKFLWQFLDDQINNHNFFFIGTMNRDTKLPQAFKSRIFAHRIKFEGITDNAQKREVLRKKLLNKYVHLDKEVDNIYLDSQLQRLNSCTGRDLSSLAFLLKETYRRYNQEGDSIHIGKKHIEEAVLKYINNRAEMEYDRIEETEAERQERYHVQRTVADNYLRLHGATQYLYSGFQLSETRQILSEDGQQYLHDTLTDTEKQLADKINERATKAQKERADKVKAAAEAAKQAKPKTGWF